jgi:energy-coupling factor transport system permease protein
VKPPVACGPLGGARAGLAAAWGLLLVAFALVWSSPVVLVAVGIAVLVAAALCGVAGDLARAARFSVPLVLTMALINALVVRDGATVLWRFGELPVAGQVDLTAEALAYGLVLGLRIVVIVSAFALLVAVVDADEVLRKMRRPAFRSALTATLATRMAGVLTRDARRMNDARRARPSGGDHGAGRLALVQAVATGALDRAVDVAATLELRGYATRGPVAVGLEPWSRDDQAVACSGLALAALMAWGVAAGVASLQPYPTFSMDAGPAEAAFAAAVLAAAVLPLAAVVRRGRSRWPS